MYESYSRLVTSMIPKSWRYNKLLLLLLYNQEVFKGVREVREGHGKVMHTCSCWGRLRMICFDYKVIYYIAYLDRNIIFMN